MGTVTLTQAQSKLDAAMTAYDKALESSSHSISDGEMSRSLSRQNIEALQSAIEFWERRVARLTRGGITIRGATPV